MRRSANRQVLRQDRVGVGGADRGTDRGSHGGSTPQASHLCHGTYLQHRHGFADLRIVRRSRIGELVDDWLTRSFSTLPAPTCKRKSSSSPFFLPFTTADWAKFTQRRINVETDTGDRVLEPADFFRNGIPASLVATSVIVTLGYAIMRFMGL